VMDLSSMPRDALEEYARNLDAALEACERNRAAYQAALADVEVLAREASETMYTAAELARMVRTNSIERKDVASFAHAITKDLSEGAGEGI
jgi:hypothetical protein